VVSCSTSSLAAVWEEGKPLAGGDRVIGMLETGRVEFKLEDLGESLLGGEIGGWDWESWAGEREEERG